MNAFAAETRGLGVFLSSFAAHPLVRSRRTDASEFRRWFGTRPRVGKMLQRHSECVRRAHNQASSKLPPFDHTKRFRLTQPPCPEWAYGDGMKPSVEQEEANLWGATKEARRTKVFDLESTPSRYVRLLGWVLELYD